MINREAIAAEAQALGLAAAEGGAPELSAAAEGEREGGRRRRRGGRGRGEREEGTGQQSLVDATEADGQVERQDGTDAATGTDAQDVQDGQGEGQDGRRRGGRGRNRRGERRDEPPADDSATGAEVNAAVPQDLAFAETQPSPLSEAEAHVLSGVLTGASAETSTEAPAEIPAEVQAAPTPPVAAAAPVAPAPALAEPAPIAAVKAAPFVLPMDELEAIAQSAGLQWVNSDAERIRQVQEAIAQEPKPVHVPRERKPVVVLDEGPLVLVETRKDLAQVTLPFEHKA